MPSGTRGMAAEGPFRRIGEKSRDFLFHLGGSRRPAEIRLADMLARVLKEFAGLLKGNDLKVSPRFQRFQEEAARLSHSSRSLVHFPLVYVLAQSTRDVLSFLGLLLQEMVLFEVPPDKFMQEMVSRSKEVAALLARALRGKARSSQARLALAKARQEMEIIRRIYGDALKDLVKQRNAVEILKRREMYRHLWRLAESLARTFRQTEEFLAARPT